MTLQPETLALWTFPDDSAAADEVSIPADVDLVGGATLTLRGKPLDRSSKLGIPYTDPMDVTYPVGQAMVWEDGEIGDAELRLTINTQGMQALALRFDYVSNSATRFHVSYRREADRKWQKALKNAPLLADDYWHSIELPLPEAVNDHAGLMLRLNNFKSKGKGELRITNVAVVAVPPVGLRRPMISPLPGGISVTLRADGLKPLVYGEGFFFHVSDEVTPLEDLSVTVESDNPAVLRDVTLERVNPVQGLYHLVTGVPSGKAGVAQLQITVQNAAGRTKRATVPYGVVVEPPHESSSLLYMAGSSNASAAMILNKRLMVVADDEDQSLRLYPYRANGLPLKSYPLSDATPGSPPLHLTDIHRDGRISEVDLEGVTQVGNRLFWIGSHSHNDEGEVRPNRRRLFATDLHGEGIATTLMFVGYYAGLHTDLMAWGDAHGYDFSASMAEGRSSKAIDGFNIEGLCIAPDGQTAYIGLRAPLVPVTERNKALIVPIGNFVAWFNNGHPLSAPTLLDPIELDLGGRGIRSMAVGDGRWYIVAGPYGDVGDFALYIWSGQRADAPQHYPVDLSRMRVEALAVPPETDTVVLLSDNGTTDWYNIGQEARTLPAELQRFRTDWITLK
ncbi:MAG: DUF3616 domain-containing protein [Phototrophicaceae bacterium]